MGKIVQNEQNCEETYDLDVYQIYGYSENKNIKGIGMVKCFMIYLLSMLGFISISFILVIIPQFCKLGAILFLASLVYIVVGFAVFLDVLKRDTWDGQVAFVKEGNTYWGVKLCYMPDKLIECIERSGDAVEKQMILSKEYVKVLQGITGKGKRKWYRDLDKNFLICNTRKNEGSVGIVRLDQAKVILKTKRWLIIRYQDYRKKYRNLRISNNYPGLAESINLTVTQEYLYTCPREDEKVDCSGQIVLYVVCGIPLIAIGYILGRIFWGI